MNVFGYVWPSTYPHFLQAASCKKEEEGIARKKKKVLADQAQHIVILFMIYAAFFPFRETAAGSGGTPPVMLRIPWLASLAQRHSQRDF